MKRIVVLGGYGEMGTVISTDLAHTAKDCEIVIAGRDDARAKQFAKGFHNKHVVGKGADSSDKSSMRTLLEGADVLINATNYYHNVSVMESALANGVNYIDLGGLYHTSLEQLKLHGRFKKKGVTAIIGCGSTPGITNVMVHYAADLFDTIKSVEVEFGDKDYTKYNMPYVLPYSIQTVFDEFSLKAPVLSEGKMRFVEPLTWEKIVEFPQPVGDRVCYVSIHSELASIPVTFKDRGIEDCVFRGNWDSDFIEKTKFLIDTGFASEKPVDFGGAKLSPRDISTKMLSRFLPPKNVQVNDMEYLRAELHGTKAGKRKIVVMFCKTLTNKRFNIPAGSWDTGVPPSIVSQMMVNGHVGSPGVFAPDTQVLPAKKFLKELDTRGIKVYVETEQLI